VGRDNELYRCEVCGQIVRVVKAGPGALFCCGEPMRRIDDKPAAPPKEAK
jgi:superoxide reductase